MGLAAEIVEETGEELDRLGKGESWLVVEHSHKNAADYKFFTQSAELELGELRQV